MPRRRRSKDNASKVWKKRKPTWTVGGALGRHAHSRHHETAGRGHVRRRKARCCCHFRWSLFAITSTANAPSIWMAAWKLKPLTTALRRAGSDAVFRCNGIAHMSGLLDPKHRTTAARAPASAARPSSHPGRRPAIAHAALDPAVAASRRNGRTAYRRVVPSDASRSKARLPCAASWACCRWRRNMASPRPTMPAPSAWKSKPATIISCAAIWNATRNCR